MQPTSAGTRDRYSAVLEFYRTRGYSHTIGFGKRPALVVIDFSLAFTKSADAFPGGSFDAEIAQTRRLLAMMRGRCPIFFTTIAYQADMHDAGYWATKVPWLTHCKINSDAIAIDSRLEVNPEDNVVVKKYPSALYETGLVSMLNKASVDTLIIAGCTTSVCVRATAIDAMQHGYRPIIAREAVADFLPELHQLHLLDIESRYADVSTIDTITDYIAGLA